MLLCYNIPFSPSTGLFCVFLFFNDKVWHSRRGARSGAHKMALETAVLGYGGPSKSAPLPLGLFLSLHFAISNSRHSTCNGLAPHSNRWPRWSQSWARSSLPLRCGTKQEALRKLVLICLALAFICPQQSRVTHISSYLFLAHFVKEPSCFFLSILGQLHPPIDVDNPHPFGAPSMLLIRWAQESVCREKFTSLPDAQKLVFSALPGNNA